MLFVAFWKISKDVTVQDTAKTGMKLLEKGMAPPKGVKLLRWLLLPGGRGVTIVEADNADALLMEWMVWINEYPGMFEYYEISPAVEATKAIESAFELSK